MENKIVFVDIETGGPDFKRHPIVQLAAIAANAKGAPVEAFEAKLKFQPRSANAYSLRKSRYHPGLWANVAREGKEVAKDFGRFLKRHATSPATSASGKLFYVAQLVAHNAAYDAPFLAAWHERLGLFLPASRLVLCTMQLAMWKAVSSGITPPNFQLATLCQHYGVPYHAASAHDALGDVTATLQLYHAMRRGR